MSYPLYLNFISTKKYYPPLHLGHLKIRAIIGNLFYGSHRKSSPTHPWHPLLSLRKTSLERTKKKQALTPNNQNDHNLGPIVAIIPEVARVFKPLKEICPAKWSIWWQWAVYRTGEDLSLSQSVGDSLSSEHARLVWCWQLQSRSMPNIS